MESLIFLLSLTSALLVLGILGTVIGITRLAYPARERRRRTMRRAKSSVERDDP
jgi:hypothetical protein